MQELAQGSKWVLPALKHFKDVCNLYPEVSSARLVFGCLTSQCVSPSPPPASPSVPPQQELLHLLSASSAPEH